MAFGSNPRHGRDLSPRAYARAVRARAGVVGPVCVVVLVVIVVVRYGAVLGLLALGGFALVHPIGYASWRWWQQRIHRDRW